MAYGNTKYLLPVIINLCLPFLKFLGDVLTTGSQSAAAQVPDIIQLMLLFPLLGSVVSAILIYFAHLIRCKLTNTNINNVVTSPIITMLLDPFIVSMVASVILPPHYFWLFFPIVLLTKDYYPTLFMRFIALCYRNLHAAEPPMLPTVELEQPENGNDQAPRVGPSLQESSQNDQDSHAIVID